MTQLAISSDKKMADAVFVFEDCRQRKNHPVSAMTLMCVMVHKKQQDVDMFKVKKGLFFKSQGSHM